MSPSSDTLSDARVFALSFDVALRLTLAASLIIWIFFILRPFMIVLLWAVILAVAFEGAFEKLCRMVGGRRRVAATVFSILAIGLVVYPSYVIGGSVVGSIRSVQGALAEGTLQAPPPPERLRNVPAVGESAYEAWLLVSDDLQQAMVQFEPQLRTAGRWLLGFLAGIGGTVLRTMLALIIAAALLAYSAPTTQALRAVARRIQGDWEEDIVGMAGATINSVARGVFGVALFQATISGAGLFLVEFPGAGLMAIAVLVLAIAQFPVLPLMMLPLIWGFTSMGTPAAIAFAVFCVAASSADMPLKAMFLGRGVSVPTSVILFGAIGGMLSMGMLGLFIGAVGLAIGYKVFQAWLAGGRLPDANPRVQTKT
ncbi:MAG: AI-2E family transporter [Longimicrobiales bacterium]